MFTSIPPFPWLIHLNLSADRLAQTQSRRSLLARFPLSSTIFYADGVALTPERDDADVLVETAAGEVMDLLRALAALGLHGSVDKSFNFALSPHLTTGNLFPIARPSGARQ